MSTLPPGPPHYAIWDNALTDNFTWSRRNAIKAWSNGMDNEKAYNENIKTNKFHTTYGRDDFDYRYNSMGIRSDELTDVELLFAGCSFTEGEGLPRDHTWAAFSHQMICDEYKISTGFHNIGRGGASARTITRKIYHAIEVMGLRPKIVLALFPSIFRKEFYLSNSPQLLNPIDYVPSHVDTHASPAQRYFIANMEKNVRLINVLNDFYADMLLIDAICGKYGIEFRFSSWQGNLDIKDLPETDLTGLPPKYVIGPKKSQIDVCNLIDDWMPTNLRHKYMNIRFMDNSFVPQKYPQTVGRDFAHPGPNQQYYFATKVFEKIKPALDKIYE